MRTLKSTVLVLFLALGALPLIAEDQTKTMDQVIDRIIAKEAEENQRVRQFTPLVETYIQNLKVDKDMGPVPAGDKYFLGRADFSHGIDLVSLSEKAGKGRKLLGNISNFFTFGMQYLPDGFLQMIFIDNNGFNRENYQFDFIRREFLGEVRCLVFDITPMKKAGKGRFLGRIWVEDQDFNVARFNGGYSGGGRQSFYFHFDSWRTNLQPGLWLPSFVYSEESDLHYALTKRLQFKAQTRLWGYNLGHAGQEQELSKVLVESNTTINDETKTANDLSPIQAQRAWDRAAEDNVTDRLQRIGLMAPRGEVDKVCETVVNNIEVTNNLDIQPEVRCRVLLTTTLESFTLGHTIVLSRGLIDVLPDEASLATMIAHELGHVVLGHRMDSQYAFFDRLIVDDKDTFRHFMFARDATEETAASGKAIELLKKSPYKDQMGNAALFLQALEVRQKQIPNLISPHLGDRVPANTFLQNVSAPAASSPDEPKKPALVAALPLGGRIKLDPWSDRVEMIKSKPVAAVAEREKMPFELTPFMPYLVRYGSEKSLPPMTADSNPNPAKPDTTKKPD
ncbi:MAG TPA: M48 family metalloprotease [Candidatus Dormibacteraeota bacterium]|nr:M48 family metalloprotease [Candidatus Dormibacteraeota bacterium]